MPVRYGIVCGGCGKLHIISREGPPSRAHYDRMRGEFKIVCVPPCANAIYFQSGMMMAYMVPDEAVERGYADLDDYRPVERIRR